MDINIAVVVQGVRPEAGNTLAPHVISCLERAKEILDGIGTHFIVPIGGDGYGGPALEVPESDLLTNHLLNELGVESKHIISCGVPTGTPEAIWELRGLSALHKIYWVRIAAIPERIERIQLLCDMLLPHLQVSIDEVAHELQPSELHTVAHEAHFLKETKEALRGMESGVGPHTLHRAFPINSSPE